MILYSDSAENVRAEQLTGFFVGWPKPPSAETHLRLLRSSDNVVIAIESDLGKVVGFCTAVTDHLLSAYIPFLEVLPEYQKRGIGRELVRRMLACLEGMYMVDLTCDAELQPFYETLGLRRATGMMLRNYERQSGEDL